MRHGLAGEIRYYGRDRAIRGRELFIVHATGDGWSLLADSVIPGPRRVDRHVSYTVDSSWRPLTAAVEVSVDDISMPGALYSFDHQRARLATADGQVSELTLSGPLDWFGAHPIVMDGWITSSALIGNTSGTFEIGRGLTSSVEHDGASAAGLNEVTVLGRYIGMTDVAVEAGHFACHEIELTFGNEFREPHPPYTVWIRAEPDHILVRANIPAFERTYELARLVSFEALPTDFAAVTA